MLSWTILSRRSYRQKVTNAVLEREDNWLKRMSSPKLGTRWALNAFCKFSDYHVSHSALIVGVHPISSAFAKVRIAFALDSSWKPSSCLKPQDSIENPWAPHSSCLISMPSFNFPKTCRFYFFPLSKTLIFRRLCSSHLERQIVKRI